MKRRSEAEHPFGSKIFLLFSNGRVLGEPWTPQRERRQPHETRYRRQHSCHTLCCYTVLWVDHCLFSAVAYLREWATECSNYIGDCGGLILGLRYRGLRFSSERRGQVRRPFRRPLFISSRLIIPSSVFWCLEEEEEGEEKTNVSGLIYLFFLASQRLFKNNNLR